MNLSAVMLVATCFFCLVGQRPATDLSSVKVVSLYESIIDTDFSTLIRVLEETHTDIVFRAYFRGFARGLNSSEYSKFVATVSEIKTRSGIQIMGAITCSVVYYPGDYWPNGTLINSYDAQHMLWLLPDGTLAHHPAFPQPVLDITKPLARQFIEDYAYRFIDAGVDSLFFDEVNIIPQTASRYGLNITEWPYVESWRQLVSSVKDYARQHYGRTLLVTLNTGFVNSIGEPPLKVWPDQDFITVGFNPKTIKTESTQDDWAGFKGQVQRTYGRLLPIMVFIDWGGGESPLSIFASLPLDNQIRVLKMLHDTALSENILFVYPVHGGAINGSITYLDPNNTYDATKQETFDTIVQLTQNLASTSTQTSATSSRATSTPEFVTATVGLYLVPGIVAAAVIGYVVISIKRRNSRIRSH